MDGYQLRKQKKQEAILAAGLKLMKENGVQKTTVSDVANAAGVSKVTIFNYYETKEKLVHEILVYYIREAFKEFEKIVEGDAPFEEKMESIIFRKIEESQRLNTEFYELMMQLYNEPGNFIEDLYMNEGIRLYQKLFTQGKREGLINPHISDQAMMIYFNIFNEGLKNENVYKAVLPITGEIMEMFLYGLSGSPKK